MTAARTINQGNHQLVISWSAVDEGATYHVNLSTDEMRTWYRALSNLAKPAAIQNNADPDLTNWVAAINVDANSTYWVAVGAAKSDQVAWTNAGPYGPVNPPAAPASVSISRSSGSLTISWPAVSGASRYHVNLSVNGGLTWTRAADTTSTSATITDGIDDRWTYIAAVRGENANGVYGAWTRSASSLSITPGAPSVTASRSGTGITISWTAPTHSGSSAVTGYDVNYSINGGTSWTRHVSATTNTTATISNADNTVDYIIAVRANNAIGGGLWAHSATLDGLDTPAPVTLTRAPGSLTVGWSAVDGASGYHVNLSTDGGWTWTRAVSDQSGTSATLSSGIVNGSGYIASVQAVNAHGGSRWTNSAAIAALTTPGAPGSLTAARSGSGISVNWSAPAHIGGTPITGYDLNYSTDGGYSWTRQVSGATNTTATISNADNTVDYEIAVRAANAIGASAWAQAATVAGLDAPASVAAYKAQGLIDVVWSAVAGATGYDVNYIFNGLWHYRGASNVSGTSIRLNAGSYFHPDQYTAAVRARNAHGPGPWTNSPTAVANPTLTASNLTASGATLTLFPYAADWYYRATAAPDKTCQGPVSVSTKDLSGLVGGRTYAYSAYSDSACSDGNKIATAGAFTAGAVSVGNLSETTYSSPITVWSLLVANAFTTGSADGGYALQSVTLDMADPAGSGSPVLVARIHAASGSNPADTALITLSGPNPSAAGQYTYVCSAGCGLAKETTYFVVLSATNVTWTAYHRWHLTSSDAETVEPAGSWSIANAGRSQEFIPPNSVLWGGTGDRSGRFRVTAVAGAGLGVTNLTHVAASLNLSNHSGGWWYQGSQSGAACTSVASGTSTAGLTGLSALTPYTYRAYGQANCTDANELASVSFRTMPPLLTGTPTATTAVLTLDAYSGSWYYQADSGPDNSCQGPVSGTTENLSGLTRNTTYAYTAYRDNGCRTALSSVASFTTTNPSLAHSSLTHSSATLTLSGWAAGTGAGKDGVWYYQYSAPSGGTCSAAQSTAAADLSSLNANTDYTWKAYSDAGCSDELASVSFFTGDTVGNLDFETRSAPLGQNWNDNHSFAVAFTAGSHSAGYELQRATISIDSVLGSPTGFSAAIHADSGGNPAASATYTLSGAKPTAAGQHSFTCPTNSTCDLTAGVTYFLVLSATGQAGGHNFYYLNTTTSDSQVNSPSGNGWSIADTAKRRTNGGAWSDHSHTGQSSVPSISLKANIKLPELSATSLTATTATLTIANHSTAWWYKRTNPTGDTTCHSVSSGTDNDDLTGLTSDTSYTYRAYDKIGCNSADEIASLTFTQVTPVSSDSSKDITLASDNSSSPTDASPNTAQTATVQDTNYPINPAAPANAHKGSGRGEAAAASATRSPGYVTNLASAQSGDSDVDATQRQAVAFTTGPSPGGYTLKSFTAALRKVSGNADLVLTLHDMAGNAYGDDSQPAATVLATLSGATPASGAFADVTYTCSGEGCVLEPDTTYFVVAESTGTGAYAWAYVAAANLYTESTVPPGSGWTLSAGHYSDNGGGWTSWGDWHHARLDFKTHPVLSVGNLAEAPHPDACFPSGDATCAVGFTTGSAVGGYTLRAITARFADADDPDGMLGDLVVTLHADNAGLPGPALATLSGDNPAEAGDYTYTCAGAGCALKPDTTYFVQVSATAGEYLSEAYAWSATLSDHETPVPAGNGWTLANGTMAYRSTWQMYPDVGLLAIVATR